MKVLEGTILEVDFKQGFTVRTEDGAVHLIGRIAIPHGNLFHFGAMTKVPEPGDGVLIVSKDDGSKFLIPYHISKLHYDTNLTMDVKDYALIVEEFGLRPGDFFILTSDLEGAFILRASGLMEFKSSEFYVKHNPDFKYGGLKIFTGNIQVSTAKNSFSFKYLHDDTLGVSVSQEISDFPSSTAVTAPIFTFTVSRGPRKYIHVTVDRITGDVAIKSDIWQIKLNYLGMFEFKAGATSLTMDIAGRVDIKTALTVNVKASIVNVEGNQVFLGSSPVKGQIVTTLTHPVCYVTGAPILGSTTCFASS